MVVKCRSCRVPRWNTDPCTNADCSSLQRVTTQPCVKRGPVTSRRTTGSYDLANQLDRMPTPDRPYLGGAVYVADFDGTHHIG